MTVRCGKWLHVTAHLRVEKPSVACVARVWPVCGFFQAEQRPRHTHHVTPHREPRKADGHPPGNQKVQRAIGNKRTSSSVIQSWFHQHDRTRAREYQQRHGAQLSTEHLVKLLASHDSLWVSLSQQKGGNDSWLQPQACAKDVGRAVHPLTSSHSQINFTFVHNFPSSARFGGRSSASTSSIPVCKSTFNGSYAHGSARA